MGAVDPQAIEGVAVAAVARRIELDHVRESSRAAVAGDVPATLLGRMKRFLRLSG